MLSSLSLRELNYYITFSSLCQVLFENFLSEVFLSYLTALEQPIYYITFSFVCQPFFQNFFSEIFTLSVDSLRAALILYHFLNSLSIPFQKVFCDNFFFASARFISGLPMLRQQAYFSFPVPSRRLIYYSIHFQESQHGLFHNVA